MSVFKCTTCGSTFAVPTRKWKLRKKGHLKHLWCFVCKRRTQHRML